MGGLCNFLENVIFHYHLMAVNIDKKPGEHICSGYEPIFVSYNEVLGLFNESILNSCGISVVFSHSNWIGFVAL